MEENKSSLPVLMTPAGMQLTINTEIKKHNLTVSELQKRALVLVKNEDNLKVMADLLADLKKVDDLAEETHQRVKKPYWDAGKACDEGKKLVLGATAAIRATFQPQYIKLLSDIADRKRKADEKKARDAAIFKMIEDNVMTFSNQIINANTKQALLAVESRINLEKSPSMAKKYGESHALAIERYDTLLPILKDQKIKVEAIEKLNTQIADAEANNDPDKMDELNVKVDELSNEVLQNHAIIQERALNQQSFAGEEAIEVLPAFKDKRMDIHFEIADLAVAFKKVPQLLEITINGKAAREVAKKLKAGKVFDGKDEVIIDGIKYIANRVREAL